MDASAAPPRRGIDPERLRAIIWLRRRISRNQWSRLGTFGRFLHLAFIAVGVFVAIGGLIGGLALGVAAGSPRGDALEPVELLLLWDVFAGGFLFFWVGYVLIDVQRSETIDAAKLLHLPVTHGQVFVLNYLASLVTPMLIATAPGLFGLAVGLSIGLGSRFLWLVPLLLGFLFVVTAFTYWLRGWLAERMSNPRRRRAIIVGITVTIVVIGQLPNLWLNVFRDPESHRNARQHAPDEPGAAERRGDPEPPPESVEIDERISTVARAVHIGIPFLWLPGGAYGLARGIWWPAALGAAGSGLLGAYALRRAYRGALRFYLGVEDSRAVTPDAVATADAAPAAPAVGPDARPARRPLVERSLPWVADETAAIAFATLRSYLRAPETRMGFAMPAVMLLCFGGLMLRGAGKDSFFAPTIPGTLAIVLLFGWIQFSANQFGFDRNGFRALLLSPVPRRRILIGKNLALFFPGAVLQVLLSIALIVIGRHGIDLVLAGFLQFLTGFLCVSIAGNWASVAAPYRVPHGSVRRPKPPKKSILIGLALAIGFPLITLPALLPSFLEAGLRAFGALPGLPAALLTSLLCLAAAAVGYAVLLDAQGRYLQDREREVLEIVTHELE